MHGSPVVHRARTAFFVQYSSQVKRNKVEKSMNDRIKWSNIDIWMLMNWIVWPDRSKIHCFSFCNVLAEFHIFDQKSSQTNIHWFYIIYWWFQICCTHNHSVRTLMHLSCRSLHRKILIKKFFFTSKIWNTWTRFGMTFWKYIYMYIFKCICCSILFIAKNIRKLIWSRKCRRFRERRYFIF